MEKRKLLESWGMKSFQCLPGQDMSAGVVRYFKEICKPFAWNLFVCLFVCTLFNIGAEILYLEKGTSHDWGNLKLSLWMLAYLHSHCPQRLLVKPVCERDTLCSKSFLFYSGQRLHRWKANTVAPRQGLSRRHVFIHP